MLTPPEKKTLINTGLHFLVWLILFLFPFWQFPGQQNDYERLFLFVWFPLILYAILFYVNYSFLIKKYLFEKEFVLYLFINCLMILVFVYFNWKFRDYLMGSGIQPSMSPGNIPDKPGDGFPSGPPPGSFFIAKDLFSFVIPVIISIAVKSTENWIKADGERKEIINKNLESELNSLKYQLQPHFFFNSLNNIYSLVELSPAKAQEAIHSLSKLMRYLLYDTGREMVDLSEEITFLKKYIQLMELRRTDKAPTTCSFPELAPDQFRIAPLLLIPIIENAFKHSVSALQPSSVSMVMTIDKNKMYFSCENSDFPERSPDKSSSGIGLVNIRKRLELIYPQKHELKNGYRDNIYWIRLWIDLD
jgi:hypothetical protein